MSERLKELRVKNKLSQTKLAAELGISQFTVTSMETGRQIPSVEIIAKYAAFFKVTTDWIIGAE